MSQVNQERLITHLCELIKVDSESGNEKQIADLISQQLAELGFEVTKLAVPPSVSNGYNIYAKLQGTLPDSIVFSCHMDTVEPGIGIEPVIDGDIIRSKGETILGADDKSGIAAVFEAVHATQEAGLAHKTIEIAFTVYEEGGLLGSQHFDMSTIESTKAIVLDTGGPIGTIVNAAPGQQQIVAVVKGRPAHAGLAPEEGINAAQVIADAISNMKLLRIDHETTANIGIIEGGMATNIVMPEAKVVAEARSLNGAKLDAQVKHMIETFEKSAKAFGAEVEIESTRAYNAFVVDEAHQHIKDVKSSFVNIGLTPQTTGTGGGSDANNFNEKGLTTINVSTGMSKVHTTEEFIAISDMVKVTNFIVDYIRH